MIQKIKSKDFRHTNWIKYYFKNFHTHEIAM